MFTYNLGFSIRLNLIEQLICSAGQIFKLYVCDSDKVPEISVVTGSNLLDSGGDRYKVEKAISHPSFSGEEISDDIALLKLKKSIEFGPMVKSVTLPTEDTAADKNLTLSGWGSTAVRIYLFINLVGSSVRKNEYPNCVRT